MDAYIRLEHGLAQWIGCEPDQVVVCSSGTAALHLALEAMRIPVPRPAKDLAKNPPNIIVPNYTMIACPLAVSMARVSPVFVDCNRSLNIDAPLIEKAIGKRTYGIMTVHVYGRLCDMVSIHEIAGKYDIPVIEDMAEAHGCLPHPNTQTATWSFYKNKIVHGEEGGCVYFRSKTQAHHARMLRNVGFTPEHDYMHVPYGHNYRMSNLHAAPILESLRSFSQEMQRRRLLELTYEQYCPDSWRMMRRDSPWVFDVRIPGLTHETQRRTIDVLQRNDIPARYGFKPMTMQPQFDECARVSKGEAHRAAEEVILLPLGKDTGREVPARCFELMRSVLG